MQTAKPVVWYVQGFYVVINAIVALLDDPKVLITGLIGHHNSCSFYYAYSSVSVLNGGAIPPSFPSFR